MVTAPNDITGSGVVLETAHIGVEGGACSEKG